MAMVVAGLSILVTTLSTARSEAHCHLHRIWHYKFPQRCFTALAPKRFVSDVKPFSREPETSREQIIEIVIPPLNFDVCPEGDERLKGIALMREKLDVSPTSQR